MSFVVIVWLFTAGVLVHNIEEAISLPAWSLNAGRWHAPVSSEEFRFAVAALSAALVFIAAVGLVAGAGSVAAYLLAGYVLAMVLNVLPHLFVTVALRKYMPGTATALLLNLPLGCLFLYRALSENFIDLKLFIWTGPLTALAIAISIPFLFALGKRLHESAR